MEYTKHIQDIKIMSTHTDEITVGREHLIFVRGGWSMICPLCGESVASGSNGVPKPLSKTCFGTKTPSTLKINKKK